jgi:hypothetical protein
MPPFRLRSAEKPTSRPASSSRPAERSTSSPRQARGSSPSRAANSGAVSPARAWATRLGFAAAAPSLVPAPGWPALPAPAAWAFALSRAPRRSQIQLFWILFLMAQGDPGPQRTHPGKVIELDSTFSTMPMPQFNPAELHQGRVSEPSRLGTTNCSNMAVCSEPRPPAEVASPGVSSALSKTSCRGAR